jgi:hypothetical protein
MSLPLINEVWKLLKPSIELGDTDGAAETLVNYLVEEDYSPAEIKQTFRGDPDVKVALDFFIETPEDGHYHEDADDLLDDHYYDEDEDEY